MTTRNKPGKQSRRPGQIVVDRHFAAGLSAHEVEQVAALLFRLLGKNTAQDADGEGVADSDRGLVPAPADERAEGQP